MERQCKIGGDGLRNRDVMNEDMISELPEALLLHILSSLPTETVIATSVLSKRWKSLWKIIPNLKFDSQYHQTFAQNVCNSLILHNAPQSLNLSLIYKCDPLEMGIWIAMALLRKVRKLVMQLYIEEDDPVIFPSVLFRCHNTLEVLKLKYSILFELTSPVCLNSLRELHLYYIQFKDEESVSNLLCGCPRLQDLVIHQEFLDLTTFSIAVPSLQRLALTISNYTENGGGYVIKAPLLKYLNIHRFKGLEFCLIENAPELVEAKVTEVSNIPNVLESLISAKRLSLSLSPLTIKYPAGKIFYQLLSLELFTNEKEWWNLLSLMLDSSPKLQILKLIDCKLEFFYTKDKEDCPTGSKWNQPKCVPECLMFHLNTFVWTRYEWEREDEKEVATYILKNSRNLKKATLTTEPIKPTELKKLERRREMLKELATEGRASNSCHLVFKSDTHNRLVSLENDLDDFI